MGYLDNLQLNKEIRSLIEKHKANGKVAFSDNYIIMPGFCDVHVHFREPGFSYKETILSGSKAGARGGYTAVCTMPNLKPCPDSKENLDKQLEIIKRDAVINVVPFGTITKNEEGKTLSDMQEMNDCVCGYSDDGRGVQDESVMLSAMEKVKSLNSIISAHCEDNSLLRGGCIHDGKYAEENGFIGISSQSEYKPISRDIELAKKTGVAYHVCHISTKESVEIIRRAKADGVNVTCETGPHYLTLDDSCLKDEGRFKMNPPLRSVEDRLALIDGIIDGTIDAIATDHAPHSQEEKSKGLKGSAFGVVGLETAFAVLYTNLVKKGIIGLEKLVELLSLNPRKRFNIPLKNDDFAIFEIKTPYTIDIKDFISQGKSSPFEGQVVYGKCVLTVYNDKVVYKG